MLPHNRNPRLLLCAAIAAATLTMACHDEPTAPPPNFARGGGGPAVQSVDPDSTPQDTTLDIHVFGSGFDNGSRVRFALHGDTNTPNIRTNSTRFVSTGDLVANITVAANAVPAKYDVVVVTSTGKPGIGTEMLTVDLRPIDLGSLGGANSSAYAISASGHIVGASATASGLMHGFFWNGTMQDLPLPSAPYEKNSSFAYGINNLDQVVGFGACQIVTGSNCQGSFVPLLWDGVGSAPTVLPFEGSGQAEDINNVGQIVGVFNSAGGGPVVWTAQGGTFPYERLPLLPGTTFGWAYAINDAGAVVGNSELLATLWFRNAAGSWTALNLGMPSGSTGARAYDIGELVGDSALVAGWAVVSGSDHAVLWTVKRTGSQWSVTAILDLSATKGKSGSGDGYGVNTNGDVVGSRYWLTDGRRNLLTGYRGGSGGIGQDINDSRWAAGYAYKPEYDAPRATLWLLR